MNQLRTARISIVTSEGSALTRIHGTDLLPNVYVILGIRTYIIHVSLICVAALLTGLLAVEPDERLTCAEVFVHPWMMRYANSLLSLEF